MKTILFISLACLALCFDRFKTIPDVLYHYIVRDDSIMGKASGTPIYKFVNLCDNYQHYLQSKNIAFSYSDLFVSVLFHEWNIKAFDLKQIMNEINQLSADHKKKMKPWFGKSVKRIRNFILLFGKKTWLWSVVIYFKCLAKVK